MTDDKLATPLNLLLSGMSKGPMKWKEGEMFVKITMKNN